MYVYFIIALTAQSGTSSFPRWSGHFRHSFLKGLFRDAPSNFNWNRFIFEFDRQGAKNKLAQFWDTVYFTKAASYNVLKSEEHKSGVY